MQELPGRIDQIYQDPCVANALLRLIYGDLNDANSLTAILYNLQPDETYNLGVRSHVRFSFNVPEYIAEVTALGVLGRIDISYREYGLSRSALTQPCTVKQWANCFVDLTKKQGWHCSKVLAPIRL